MTDRSRDQHGGQKGSEKSGTGSDRDSGAGSVLQGPGTTGSSSTPGPDQGGYHASGMSAADLGGGGAGGDIDRPDVSGRGTTDDALRAQGPGSRPSHPTPGDQGDTPPTRSSQ